VVSTLAAASPDISLAGKWQFAIDRADSGVSEQWFNRDLSETIQLPGALQSQGYGDEISVNTPWVLSLYDKLWYLRDDYRAFTNAGTVKVPFLCQPPRHYLGAAWYQRDVEIPADWKDRRVVLFLERPRWESRVWVDDKLIGTNNSLCVPHEFDLGQLAPGKHRLSVRVDNRLIMPYRPDAHSVSDSLGSTWNGIVGKIELRSTPLVWIEDLRLFPDAEKKQVRVSVRLGNSTGKRGKGGVQIWKGTVKASAFPDVSLPVSWDANENDREPDNPPLSPGSSAVPVSQHGKVDMTISFGDAAALWDEFHPALQNLIVELVASNSVEDSRNVVVGLRDFKAEGRKFFINDRETYLRGTHNGGDFPLTGYPPTDVESWKKIIRTCQEWGLNHMRFHSWCPPEAAFVAADELGFYLQPECGMWNSFDPGSTMEKMLYLETERILKAYGNHPSFVMLSPSNEPKGHWRDVLPKWAEHFRSVDTRRLYTSGTGFTEGDAPGPLDRVDYTSTSRFGPSRVRGESAWFGRDYSRSLQNVKIPVVAHELGQWCAYPDYSVIKKFTGYLRPGNYEIFRDSLAAHGLLEKNRDFAWASGRFQLACYKEEIEANLRTPGLAGFQLLDLHDYVGQGTALVGLLDTFWEEKGFVTPAEFKMFCGPVVPLARLPKRVFTSDETLNVDVDLANFGPAPLTNQTIFWRIAGVGEETSVRHQDTAPIEAIPIGKIVSVAKIHARLEGLAGPGAYVLEAGVRGAAGAFTNRWNIWVYPRPASNAEPADVFVTSSWDEAEPKLAAGGTVLFLPRNADLDWTSPPLAEVPVFWNRLMNPAWGRMLGLWCDTNNPALAGFPTEPNCDWQWTQIIRGVRAVNLDRLPRGLQPIVQAIDDWNRNWKLGLVFECKVGSGKLMVCSFDLERDLEQRPVARQLRRSLLDYMAGGQFQPKTDVSVESFRSVLFDTQIMRKLGATAGDDSGAAAIDGDPNTAWIAGGGRGAAATKYPHQLTITFPAPVAMNGVVLMPRQNDRDHLGDVRSYRIEASDDGAQWREVSRGELVSTWSPQTVKFAEKITTRQLRFVALSGFGNDSSAALAELAVIYAGPKLGDTESGPLEYRRTRSTSTDVDEGADPAAVPRNH
jgi:hypothetical protein